MAMKKAVQCKHIDTDGVLQRMAAPGYDGQIWRELLNEGWPQRVVVRKLEILQRHGLIELGWLVRLTDSGRERAERSAGRRDVA